MAGDKFDQLYNALKADGAVTGTREHFRKFVYAPGKQGYHNRKQLYDALHADGAVSSNSYEEFAQRLGLHAVNPKPQQKPVAQQKPMTTAQRAMQVPHRLKTQLGKAQKSAPKSASPFVQSLYEIDEAQNGAGYPVDYTSPKATQQVYQRNQRIRRQAAKTAAKKISRQASHAQPIMQTNTPADTYIGKTEGQLIDEMNQSANSLVGSEMGDYLDKVIGDEFKTAHARGLAALSANSGVHGTGGADWWIGERAYQNQMDQDKQLQEITGNIQKNIESIFSNPKVKQRVLSDAQKLGVSPETYIESSLAPALIEKAGKQFNNTQLNRMMAKGASDYIASGILNSLTGTLLTGLTSTKSQRQMQQQADAMTEEGLNPNYKPGTWAKAAKGAVAFAADAPWYNLAGVGAGALTEKVFGNAAQQMARIANQSLRQRVFEGVARGIVHGGATGFQYGAINGAVQNYSTGEDTSLLGTLKAAGKGGLEEGVSFATMEGMGGAVGAFGHGIGLKGTEKTWKQRVNKMGQKLTYEGIKTGMEGIGMATGGVASSYANHILTGDDWHGFSTEGTLESCASAVIFKLTHAKDLFKNETDRNGKPFSFTSNIAQKTARFFLSGETKSAPHVFSDEEKHQLFAAGSELGMKPMENIVSWAKQAKKYRAEDIEKSEDGSDLLNNYQQIMLDPNVSWDAKAKFTTMVMGTMPESRPMMDHISYGTEDGTDGDNRIHTYKTVNEYAADGTLLSKHRFDTKDKRESIIYEIGVRKEELRSKNALALLVGLDRNNYDLQNSFFKKNAKDWEQVQEIVEGMQTGGSKIDHQFTEYVLNSESGSFLPIVDAVASKNGMDRESVLKAFYKDPMKRTDAEQNACVQLRKAIEMEVFPANKVHEEQSVMDGKDVAKDNNLGTMQPEGGAVKAELDGLRQAETEMDELMRDNDVFGQNFQKLKQQGLSNPQIYDWMIQQGGLTVEQLEPFAHYINANARVQGMQEATKNAIDEQVSSYVQDWSFHGTLNGQEKNGEQAIYVQDSNGRTLLVGTGEVAFDTTTGRAKEGVGDMLVCLDPKTGDTVYVKSDEVKFVGTQSTDDFANGYLQELQMKNSEPYNQAAQEQAIQDAAKPHTVEKSKDDATKGGDLTKDDTTLTKVDTTSGKDNTTSEDLVPQEHPQQKDYRDKLADLGIIGKDESPVGGIKNNPENGLESRLTKAQETLIEKKVERVLENPNSTISDLHDAIVFKLNNGDRSSANITVLDAIYKVFDAYKRGEISKEDVLNFIKEQFVGEEDNPLRVALEAKRGKSGVPPQEQSIPTRKFADGSDVPMTKDSKGRPTPDYEKMTPEQSAEILTEDFGENADKVVDGQIQKAEKALKDAEKMKVDYTAEPNDIMEQEALKKKTVEAAKKQLEHAQNIKKTMTAKKVAETVERPVEPERDADGVAQEAGVVSPKVKERFEASKKIKGRRGSITLADGTKIRGTYYYGETSGLTTSHDPFNDFKQSDGFPVNEDGTSSNSRSYRDKESRLFTQKIGNNFNGLALKNVPVVQEGITLSGNGTVMGKKLAEQAGKDSKYYEDLEDNAEGFGWTPEQIKGAGFKGIVYFVPDEKLPLNSKTFDLFNKKETKSESNTEQAVKNAKTLTSEEVGAIVAEIEGSGSLDAFFNNSKAINDLVKTLVDKGIIGQNEVAQMMDNPERLSAQGREYVKNLLLGSIFKPETIRMLGIDSAVKNKAINAIRSVMDNMKLGDYSLREEIDQAIQLLYEARQGGNKVDTLLRTPDMFGEDAAKRYPSISQMMALALEGKVADFRDLLDEYNRIADSRNTGEGNMFESAPTKEELINEYLNFKKWQDYGTGHSENEGGNDVSGIQEPKQETSGGNGSAGEGAEPERPRVEETGDKELGDTKVSANPKATISERKQALLDRIASGTVKRKDEAWGMLADAEELLAEYYGIPYDEYGGRQRTSSTTIDIVLNIYTKGVLDKITDEPIPAATEKQMNYLMKLAKGEHLWESGLYGMIPNKRQASWLINAMKGLGDEYLLSMHPDEIEEREREIYNGIDLVRKANGANAYDWDRMRLLPREENPDPKFNPIEAAAAEFKKEHPLTEEEIMKSDVDDLSKDMALDYLNGEVTDDLHRAIYESIYSKRKELNAEPKVDTSKTEPSANPMEEIKNAAEGFEKEKKTKIEQGEKPQQKADDAAVSASNKKVNDLWKELMNAGKDEVSSSFIGLNSRQLEVLPKLVSAMAENAYLRIKRGMHNLEDVVKEMRKEFAPAAKIFKKEDVDAIYEQMMNIRYRDGEQRMSLKEWADYYEKISPKHQENLVGDSKSAEERKQAEKKFIDAVKLQLAFGRKFKSIVELRKFAERHGLNDIKDTDLQELVEAAIVQRARSIAASEATDNAGKFKRILNLYENQPSLNQRDSERVMKQQYSTPAPYAFLADMYVKGNGKEIKSALEPSAGNGMLTIGLPMDAVHVNDIDAQRLENLRKQGFKNVTSQDGTQPFADKDVDVVVTNPPFGSATPKEYDGYKISSLEGQMAINALESMKDDGRAAIIIGGKTEYAKNGSLNPKDKAFLGYLYSHYNVEDVINVDGSLYAKQGTSYPTRIILINGRRNYDPEHKVFPPVEKDARAETVKDYDELYKRIEDDILRSTEQPVDIRRKEKREGDKPSGRENVSDSVEENGVRGRLGTTTVSYGTSGNSEPTELDVQSRPVEQSEDADGRPVKATGNGDSNTDGRGGQTSVPKSGPADGGSGRGGNVPSGGNEPVRNGNGENGRESGVRHGSGHIQQSLENTPKEEKKQSLTTEKVKYQPHSAAYSIGAVVPARQKEALDNVLNKLGDADQYLVDNLGYNDKEDLYAHLAAEQIDAVALGLKQMEKGNGFIIGDQTGIGKGRQAASIIRYAVKQGRIPISFTQKANLFSDTYRDLNDIGSPELRPFILASSNEGNIKVNYDEEVKGPDGKTTTVRKQKVVYKVPSKTETERVLKYISENGKLPEGYDYILTTYSQIRNGLEEFKGGKWKAKKKVTATDRNSQMKRDAIKRIAENSVFILDESHDAAGEGSGSAFIQDVLPKVKGVTFLSATYAKTPDAMKLYALKTDLGSKNKEEGENGDASWKVLNAIKKGGAVFQEIMSQALIKSGQMIRRERDMTGVTIDWNPLTENEVEIQGQRDKFDNIFGIFNDILDFQRTYVDAKLGQMSDDLALIQGSADHTPGTKDMGIGNVTFASKAYNVVQQALFSIKAEKVADYAIEAIKNGEKPVIAVNNTMGSMIDEYPMGVEMDMPDLNSTLMKGLEGILRYTEKNDMGDQVNSTLRVEELGEEAVARYNEIKQKIASVSSGLSISPIDVIKHRLEEAGYKVGELTGRNTEMVYTEDGKVIRKNRTDKNKNALADRFNNGDLDALILNRSAAAGISLHASSKYKDQRQRTMIFAQMQGNINDEVQIRGRIDRTGQVRRGKYVYLVSAIPAEQRLMMMFKNKLKSLDANTTSSQKSKFNEVDVQDFTNKYGDEIVLQYMAQHPEYYNKLADPLGWGFMEYARDGLSIGELKYGMKPNITSPAYEVMKRLTLLPVKEQEVVLKDISDSYSQKIKQLNDMGMNDLEMTDMPLEAKTLKREVWKEGSDPNGDNAFADNTYIETVEMNVLKKPMKAEEVEAAQKKMLDGKDYETWRKDKVAEIRAGQQAKIEDTKAKMAEQTEKKVSKVEESTRLALEKENDKIQKKIDKGEDLKPGEHILTEEEIKTRVNVAVDDVKRRLSKKLSDAIENVNVKYDMFINPLFAFDPNKTISVPNDWYLEEASTSLYPEFGRVIGFKFDKNYNLGSSSIVIATTDSRKRVEIPLNRPAVLERIQADSERFSKECKVVNMDAWDRMIPKKDRTTGRIITGNMLEALADNSSIGHLISYTTDDGKVKQGILVPDGVSIAEITGNLPIAKAYDWFTKKTSGTELASTDGTLRLTKNSGSMYALFVPASRKEGGKYYLNQYLLDLVHGHNFQSKGKNFWATFDAEKLKDVLNVLNGMGVEVKTPYDYSESGTHFREDRGLQYSKTDTKDVKNSRIIPEDVDKNVSSQIEKTFNSAIEEIVENAEDRDKSRLVDDADHAVDEFSNLGRSVIEYYRNDYERKVEKLSGQSIGGHLGGKNDGKGNRGSYLLQYYKTILAVADRELAYRDVRAKNLRETWGLQPGGTFTLGDVERIFKETNRDKEKAELFEKALDISKRLGVNIKVSAESPNKASGEADIYRNIDLYIDGLVKTKAPDDSVPTIMLHEMIHEATMGAINLVKKGKAEGVLTPKQIEGVKTILEIYDRVKDDKERFKEEPYGLTDAYELTAQMADSRQRKAMDLSILDRVVNAAHEFARKGDRSILQRLKDAWKKLFEISDKDKMDKALNNIMDDFNETIDDVSMNEIEQDGFAYKVTDKDELDRLNKEKTFRMYSGMQEVDGKLYSPMAAIIDGKRTDATEIGAWMGADERPDLVKNGKFTLVKTDKNKGIGEGDVPAAYNPYMHTSTSMMNDQFTGAYARGNIKVVEWEIPESEKTSGYHAEGAKDSVGLVPWHSGSVNSLLPKDRQRQVMLSRWRKAVRVVPDSEVAESIAEQLKGTGLAIPWNVVTPNQVRELAKLGVPITTVESGRQATETKEKFLQQMADLEQEFPQAKFVNVKMTKDAFKVWGKDSGTKFRTDNGKINYPASSVENHVEKVAQKTGSKVKMVSSVDEITNKAAKAAIEEGRKITGWYDEKTGEVHLYMPNIHDRYTAEKTIWHEVVGHKGMRELFGEERFQKFLRDVWYDLDKQENTALKKLVDEERKFNPMNIYDAIEEGIARLAEDGKGEPGFWNGIKNKVSDFLHEIGYRIAPNTKDVKYLLWLSKNLQKNPNDPYWKLRAEAVRYRLDHEDILSVVSRDGVFYENDGKARSLADLPKADYQEATDGQIHFRTTPTAATALDRYHRSLDEHGYMATESYMDNMLSLKKLMNAIVPDKKIEDIASSENPYILQNVMQGAMSDAAKMFEINIMSPLEKSMAGVLDAFEGKKTDDKIRNFNLYMITKHGLERNRVLFVRDAVRNLRMDDSTKADAEKLQSEWDIKKEDLGNQLNSGIIDLKRYYEKMDEWIRDNVNKDYEAGEHDYSGMHGVQDIISMKDPYNDGEAIQSVMDSEAKMESVKAGSVRDYWDKVRAATRYSVDSDYNNGIIDRDLHEHVSKMFDWYVPLRNYDETTAEDVYGYITEIGDPKNRIGSTIAKARGHKYLSETNILAQIGALGNRAIKNGGDNAIKQAFARFARNHSDNNLIKETSVWYVKDPATGIVEERYPDIPEGATADEINQIVSDFDTDMAMLKSQGLATKKFDRGNIGYRFERAKDKSQHIVDVMIAGKKHSFVILGNPRAAQALNGTLEHKNESLAGRTTAAISRFMAQTCTSYNPEFVMRNMIRDFEFASTNLLAKEGMAYTKTFEKYYAQVGLIEGIRNTKLSDFKKMTGFGLFSKYRNGTLDTSDKIQRYFKEFIENGGETGWVQIKNMKDLTAEYKLHVKTEKNGKARVSKNVFDFIFKNLENANEVAENLARFATYCASRDAGRSAVRSAYDAKEVSVNFNRHGSGNAIYSFKNGEMSKAKTARKNVYGFWASWFRNSSMFFNAGVQSTNLLIKNFKNNKAGTIGYIMAGPMMSGMAMALINNMLIASEDEKDRKGVKDPYGELPDYIRRNNLCIYVGGGEFITIPLAIEERAFYGLGDLAAGLTFSKNISGQKNPALDAVGCMSQLVPVADYLGNASFGKNPGEETIKAIAPSAVSPIIEWFFNSDWKGAPIHRENKFDENQPSWMLAYKGTPEWLININKKANAWSNDVAHGNENMKGNDFLDAATDPSLLQHLYSSYLGGAATFMERVGGLVKKGKDTETKDIPFVRSLFYTPSEQTSLQRTKSKWYNYLDETEKMIANAKRLKSNKVPLDELVKNYGDYYKFKQSKGAEKMNVIETATKEMKRWKELRNKSNDAESINFANQNIDYIMMRAVNELDKLN